MSYSASLPVTVLSLLELEFRLWFSYQRYSLAWYCLTLLRLSRLVSHCCVIEIEKLIVILIENDELCEIVVVMATVRVFCSKERVSGIVVGSRSGNER